MSEFSADAVMVALHRASGSLRAARIVNVYLDMEEIEWSACLHVVVETEHKMGRQTHMTIPEQDPQTGEWTMVETEQVIWFPELCPVAEQAVRAALSEFEPPATGPGESASVVYIVRERLSVGQHVWPVDHVIAALETRIATLQREIDRITALVGPVVSASVDDPHEPGSVGSDLPADGIDPATDE